MIDIIAVNSMEFDGNSMEMGWRLDSHGMEMERQRARRLLAKWRDARVGLIELTGLGAWRRCRAAARCEFRCRCEFCRWKKVGSGNPLPAF